MYDLKYKNQFFTVLFVSFIYTTFGKQVKEAVVYQDIFCRTMLSVLLKLYNNIEFYNIYIPYLLH